jgi:hypothetical protein
MPTSAILIGLIKYVEQNEFNSVIQSHHPFGSYDLLNSFCQTSFTKPIKIAGVGRECITLLKDVG